MRFCMDHWNLAREVLDTHGLTSLIATSGEADTERMMAEINGTAAKDTFDPLMSLNWHYSGIGLKYGGLGMMTLDEKGEHRCPVCALETIFNDFVARDDFNITAAAMASHCRDEGLLPKVN